MNLEQRIFGALRGRRWGWDGRPQRRRRPCLRALRVLPAPLQEKVEDALDRDADPIGAVVQLVADLVEGLLQGEELDQGPRVLAFLGVGDGSAHALGVPVEEGPSRTFLPESDPGFEVLQL